MDLRNVNRRTPLRGFNPFTMPPHPATLHTPEAYAEPWRLACEALRDAESAAGAALGALRDGAAQPSDLAEALRVRDAALARLRGLMKEIWADGANPA